MGRFRVLAVLTAVVVAVAVGAVAAAADPAPGEGDRCGRTSWLAGTTELCDGVVVYRDYVMDDYGAGDPLDPTSQREVLGSLSPTAGDERYDDPSRAGTADLVDLTIRLDGGQLEAVFRLNALYEPDSTIAALAIDTDDNRATGGGAWPGLGIASDGWDVLEQVANGDPETNTLKLTMPVPAGDRWRLQAVTAKADGTVMNVAFRGIDEQAGPTVSSWWEGKQARALGEGDISEFGAKVDLADLRDGVTREADHTAPGFHARVFTSAWTIGTGEGYSYEPEYGRHGDTGNVCEQEFVSFGRYQPYSVYVPAGGGTKGLQLFLHGCNANHTSQINGDGFQQQFGDDLDRVIVAPLGRGPVGYYSDISEADVLEATHDAHETYGLDADKWFISGYSMGGYGTLRLGALYPDLWAGATNWVGFTGDANNNPTGQRPSDYPSGAIGNAIDFVGNLEWVPSEHLYAGGDELVQTHTHLALAMRMDEAGIDHAYYLHPAADHLTFVLLDEWGKEAADSKGRTRVANPPRVRFRTDESLAFPEYDLRHDRAYWVSRIRARDDGYSDVDLTTAACGGSLPVRESDHGAGPRPVPWVSQSNRTVDQQAIARANELSGTIANVSSLVIDLQATCLETDTLTYDITTDGPVTLLFSDGTALPLNSSGRHQGSLGEDGGGEVVESEDRTAAADESAFAGADGAAPTLPATGGPAALGGLFLLAAGLMVRRAVLRP